MNLNELKDRAYSIAKEHGWHDEEHSDEHLLMLVITELSEAVNADRKGKHADVANFKEWQGNNLPLSEETRVNRFKEDFEAYIKDSVEDEIADVVIRCLDISGLRGIKLSSPRKWIGKLDMLFTEYAFNTCHVLTYTNVPLAERIDNVISRIFFYCESKGIDIDWFILQKMEYNKLREYKHGGKKY